MKFFVKKLLDKILLNGQRLTNGWGISPPLSLKNIIMNDFFTQGLDKDFLIESFIENELQRQRDGIELIASENYVSKAVLDAQGSILTNKYAEGYPNKRYYGGCEYMDSIENLAIERAKYLFNCSYANVQPHSGSQANQAVFLALLQPGDTILGLRLDHGGHLTHGSPVNMSGKWFNAEFYSVDQTTETINYDELREVALRVKPKMITAGASAYPRIIDFEKMSAIAKEVGAYFMADIAHIAGLVVSGVHPSPFPWADVVTTTTHKTLRGPRGGMILTNDEELSKMFNKAVFPGLQGGPLMHVIAGKAVAFGEAMKPSYNLYINNVINNCKTLSDELQTNGIRVVSGGTDNHLLLIDVSSLGLTGDVAEAMLEQVGLTTNKNMIPYDKQPPSKTSGIRIGTVAGTTRGFREDEFRMIAQWIAKVLVAGRDKKLSAVTPLVKREIKELCDRFPIY